MSRPRTLERLILRFALILALGATVFVFSTNELPLGVPGEWTWARVTLDVVNNVGLLLAFVAGAVYIGFALLGAGRIERAGRLERFGWLTALAVVAFGWMCVAVDAPPQPHGYARVPWVLYYPRSSGYFWQARYEVQDASSFLVGYEDMLAGQDYLHIGTHPPGLTLCYRGLLHLCNASPELTAAVLATRPTSVADSLATIRNAPLAGVDPLTQADEASLWLAALLTQLAAVLTAVGIYALAVRHVDRRAAWMAACLWPLVPACIVFLPKSDVLYPLLAVTAAWLWTSACNRGSILRATLTGLVLWAGMMLSLAFVSVMALLGVMSIWEAWTHPGDARRRSPIVYVVVLFGAALGFAVPSVVLWRTQDVNLLNVWAWNLSNHALFYEHNIRTWQAWLLVNPLEMAFGVGLPIAVAALFGACRLARWGWRTPRTSATIAFIVVWGLLWVSGKNMGEAARLWILIMPWVLLMAAQGLATEPGSQQKRSRLGSIGAWLLVTQWLATIVTIMQVDGFHFEELLKP